MGYDVRTALGWITVVAVVVAVFTYGLAIVIGFATVVATDLGSQLLSLNGHLPVEAFLLFIPTPLPVNLLVLVFVCLIVFCICFIVAGNEKKGFFLGLKQLSHGSRPSTIPNWLVVMPLVSSTLLIIVLLLTEIESTAGLPTGSLNNQSPALLFADLTYSPIAEEVGFRATALGLALGLIAVVRIFVKPRGATEPKRINPFRLILLTMIFPDYAKGKAGLPTIATDGWRGIHWADWLAVIGVSTIFGLDHYTSGSGWGPGKVLTAGLSGFVLALTYMAYGPYADILLHWFFNFYVFVYGTYVPLVLDTLVFLGVLSVGVWGIIVGISWIIEKPPTITPGTSQPEGILPTI
jgi:Type II CAAX prenyl endopeptidase Rce1-like